MSKESGKVAGSSTVAPEKGTAYKAPQQYEPKNMNPSRFLKYQSLELRRLDQTLGRMWKSAPYIAGCLALAYAFSMFEGNSMRTDLYGQNKNGGRWLTIHSRNNDSDMAYNREFQRNRYLSESPLPSTNFLTSEQHLAELGILKANLNKDSGYDKRAPHPKYYY